MGNEWKPSQESRVSGRESAVESHKTEAMRSTGTTSDTGSDATNGLHVYIFDVGRPSAIELHGASPVKYKQRKIAQGKPCEIQTEEDCTGQAKNRRYGWSDD